MIHIIIRTLCLLLAVFALALCAACDSSAPAGNDPAETEKPEDRTLELDLSGFVIMRSDTASKEETDVAVKLRNDISELCGIDLQIQTDWIKRGAEPPADTAEIVVGKTNRRTDETLRLSEWSVTREGNRVYILGGSAEALAEAESVFAAKYLMAGGCAMKDGAEERYEATYPITSLSVGGVQLNEIRVFDICNLSGGLTDTLIALLAERTGLKAEAVVSKNKANIIITNQTGNVVEKGKWGLYVSSPDNQLCIVGRTKIEMKKAINYLIDEVEKASGTLDLSNAGGKSYIHTEKQMSAEEYREQKQLVIYPEYPAMINRNYDYQVSVTMDKDTASIPVYDHVMSTSIKGRALHGDLHRRFSQFAFSAGQVRVDVKVKSDFASYTVVPSAKGLRNEYKDGVISVWLDKPEYFLIMLDDDLNSILAVLADYPEFPEEIPDRDDPNVLFVDGVYKTENGLLDISRDNYTIYVAPGAVMNCRVRFLGNNNSVIGHGAFVDPFENLYDYSILVGGSEAKGHSFLSVKGNNILIDGPVFLDARCYNIFVQGTGNTVRYAKILSLMMTTDGISNTANQTIIEHCFIYNGDNSLVIGSVDTATYNDLLIGTTCSAVFPQGSSQDVQMKDIYVFRVGEAVVKATYNTKENPYVMNYTFDNLDCTDMTYLPYFFQGNKMRTAEKKFTFVNTNVPLPIGTADPHVSATGRTKGTNYFFLLSNPADTQLSENFIFDFTNLYVNGKLITDAEQLDNNGKQFNNPMTFRSNDSYTPPAKNGQTVNYKAPDKVYADSLLLQFSADVKKDGTTWLLPAEEIRSFLRKPDAKVTTVKKDGAEYIKSTDLVSAGLAKTVTEKDGTLVITPVYNGENILLPDSGEVSRFTEQVCYQVDVITQKDADGVYYSARNITGSSAGIARLITNDVRMYGAGTYRLTFKTRSDEEGKISASCGTEVTSSTVKSYSIGSVWAEHTLEFTIRENDLNGYVSISFSPNVTPFISQFDVRDITLVKVN